jgi:hypothetical protein
MQILVPCGFLIPLSVYSVGKFYRQVNFSKQIQSKILFF